MNRSVTAWALFTLAMLWFPTSGRSVSTAWHMDLLAHLGLFWVLGGWGWSASDPGPLHPLRWAAATGGIALIGEAGQLYIPGRSFQFLDLWVNAAGLTAGALWTLVLVPRLGSDRTRRQTLLAGLAFLALGAWGNTTRDWLVTGYIGYRFVLIYGGGIALGLLLVIRRAAAGRPGAIPAAAGLGLWALHVPPATSPVLPLLGGLGVAALLWELVRTPPPGTGRWMAASVVFLGWLALVLPPDRFLRQAGGWLLLAILVPLQVRLAGELITFRFRSG